MRGFFAALIGFSTLFLSVTIYADEQIIEESLECEIGGCVLACISPRGDRQVISDKAREVTIRHYPSGNVEYILAERSGSNPIRVLLGNGNLQCALTGLR